MTESLSSNSAVYEVQEGMDRDLNKEFRVTDTRTDSRVATCYVQSNADLVCAALNAYTAHEPPAGVKCTHCNGKGYNEPIYDEQDGWIDETPCETCNGSGRITTVEQYLKTLPANWHEDSSLETWFPITAEELKRLKDARATVPPTSVRASNEQLAQALRNLRDVAHREVSPRYSAALDKAFTLADIALGEFDSEGEVSREADVGPGGGVRATHATGSAPSKPGAAEPPEVARLQSLIAKALQHLECEVPEWYEGMQLLRSAVTKSASECGACDKPGEHCANVHGICSRHGGRAHETDERLSKSQQKRMETQAGEPMGRCCYGGFKPRSHCSSCAAWEQV